MIAPSLRLWILGVAVLACLACSEVKTASSGAPGGPVQVGAPSTQAEPPPSVPIAPSEREVHAWGHLEGDVVIDGSSTVFPITEAVAVRMGQEAPGLKVQLGVSGTGGGFEKFCRGLLDIADASRPIKVSEARICRQQGVDFVEIPIGFDGLSVVAHGGNDWAQCITTEELRSLWQPQAEAHVLSWNQVRPEWPERSITLYGPGGDSGTFDYFTRAIVGHEGSSRGDFIGSEDDYLLAQKIARDPNGLGFFGYAYFHEYQSQLRLVAVDNGEGCVEPSAANIHDGKYTPLARPVFLYASIAALERPEVAGFVEFFLHHAEELVQQAGYVPLPSSGYGLMKRRVAQRHHGSIFGGGSQVGVSIKELLRLESADQGLGGGQGP